MKNNILKRMCTYKCIFSYNDGLPGCIVWFCYQLSLSSRQIEVCRVVGGNIKYQQVAWIWTDQPRLSFAKIHIQINSKQEEW
jgi:hypothetical protein